MADKQFEMNDMMWDAIRGLQSSVTVLQGQLEIQVSLNRIMIKRIQKLEAQLETLNITKECEEV